MKRYQIISLVDITKTSPGKAEQDSLLLGQQSNFNTLLQAINLRANIAEEEDLVIEQGRFPDPISGKGRYWIYEFETEHADCFLKDQDPIGHLVEDLDGIPIISNLTETVELNPPVFRTNGKQQNVWITVI